MAFNAFQKKCVELTKYISISAVALGLDYSVYILCLELGLEAPASSVAGYFCGLILAYLLMKNKIFMNGWLQKKRRLEFLIFLISGFLGILLTYATVYITSALIHGAYHLAKINAIFVSFIGVYFFRSKFIFRTSSES